MLSLRHRSLEGGSTKTDTVVNGTLSFLPTPTFGSHVSTLMSRGETISTLLICLCMEPVKPVSVGKWG